MTSPTRLPTLLAASRRASYALTVALGVALVTAACHRALPPDRTPSAPYAAPRPAAATAPADIVRAAVDAPDRDAADRALDPGRRPAEMLAFFGITPGMRVAEIGAGMGYTSELLARVVGLTGAVYGQNSRFLLERFAEKPWSARLAKPVMRNVKRVDRDFDDPLPPDARELDAVVDVLFYHDTVWLDVDREKMNRAIFDALKPGGIYGIVDHSARAGSGLADVKTLHRIDEDVVRQEITRVGFRFVAEASFLRNPADARDWNDAPTAAAARRGTSDRFVYKFVKPMANASTTPSSSTSGSPSASTTAVLVPPTPR